LAKVFALARAVVPSPGGPDHLGFQFFPDGCEGWRVLQRCGRTWVAIEMPEDERSLCFRGSRAVLARGDVAGPESGSAGTSQKWNGCNPLWKLMFARHSQDRLKMAW